MRGLGGISRLGLSLFILSVLSRHALSQSFGIEGRHVPIVVSNGSATLVSLPSPGTPMTISFVLRITNESALRTALQEISDPRSLNFKKYLAPGEFTKRYGPSQGDIDLVCQFALSHGLRIVELPRSKMFVKVSASVSVIESALNVHIGQYASPTGRRFYSIDREPTFAESLPVLHIEGLENEHQTRVHRRLTNAQTRSPTDPGEPYRYQPPDCTSTFLATGSGPCGSFLGSDKRAAYYGNGPMTGAGQTVAIYELGGYSLATVQTYFSSIGQPFTTNIANVVLSGANATAPPDYQGDDVEAIADIVAVASMAPRANIIVYIGQDPAYIGPSGSILNSDEYAVLDRIADDDLASIASISYSFSYLGSNSPAMTDYEQVLMKMASEGMSALFSSGDLGSYQGAGDTNFGEPGNAPEFPSTSYYATSVGGTSLVTNGAGGTWYSEEAWGWIANSWKSMYGGGGGGGISDGGGSFFVTFDPTPIPDYQQNLNFTTSGASNVYRNMPDISAESGFDNYYCYTLDGTAGETSGPTCPSGNQATLAGTSIAAPTWAGFIALMNQQAAMQGQPAMGFLNPTLYQIGSGASGAFTFYDPVGGNNAYQQGQQGYTAVAGYDLSTGLGSPNYISTSTVAAPQFYLQLYELCGGQGCSSREQVTISDSDAQAQIYYTTDGSIPDANSTLYTGPFFCLSQSCNVKAYAVDGSGYSDVATL